MPRITKEFLRVQYTVLAVFVYICTSLNEKSQGSSWALRAPEMDAGGVKYSTNLNCVKLKNMISFY